MASTTERRGEPTVTSADGGEALWALGALVVIKTDGDATDGAFSLLEHTADPGFETPYHVHRREDELFYILEGEIDCLYGDDGEHVLRAGPDETVFLPRDVAHGFRVVGDEPCRMLIQLAPAGFEGFFEAIGVPAQRTESPPPAEPDLAALTAAAAELGLEVLGPLPE